MTNPLIAVDWGTTQRRAYLLAQDGAVLDSLRDERGVLSLGRDDYPSALASLRDHFGLRSVLCAGMVGSSRGWREAPYVDAPATVESLAARALRIDEDAWILPGVARRDPARPDVMRGEEVMVLGAVAAGLVPETALLALPGTHNKWVTLNDGAITDFTTAMTGELFAMLRRFSTLAEMLAGVVEGNAAFVEGVMRGARTGNLIAALFEARSGVLLGTRTGPEARDRTSGLLIGADIAASPGVEGRVVHLLAVEPLASLYAFAIEQCGGRAIMIDSETAFAAGMHRIHLEMTR